MYKTFDNTNLLQPFGLAMVSGFLKENGFNTILYDAAAYNTKREEIIRYVMEINPQILGLTLVTQQIPQAIPFLSDIKKILPEIIIVAGGAHPSAEYSNLIEKHREIDIAVFGEGEQTMQEIIECLQEEESLKSVKGIAYRVNGKTIANLPRELIPNLDSLPFADWESLPMDKYWYNYTVKKNYSVVLFSRGCPFSCTFCAKTITGKTFRKRSPEHIIEELTLLYDKFGVRDLLIADALLNLDNNWLNEICEKMLRMNRPLVWGCQIRADRVDRKTLRLMKRSGCWKIFIGVESADNSMLERMKKGETIENIEEGINIIQEEGVIPDLGFIIGLPGETEESIKKTIAFAKKHKKCVSALNLISPFPGTQIYEISKKEGLLIDDWSQFNQNDGLSYVPKDLTREKLLYYYKLAVRSAYLRFSFLFGQIRQVRSWLNFKIRLMIAYKVLIRRFFKSTGS